MNQNEIDELLPVVDEQGNVIGKATRGQCHAGLQGGPKILHPVVHLHVVNGRGDVMLQLRSATKVVQPGKWDTAVGGHVGYGEAVADALVRESNEEIGIDASIVGRAQHVASYVFESAVERELVSCNVVVVSADDSFSGRVEPGEADELRFWRVSDIEAALGHGVFTPNFEHEFQTLLLPYLKGISHGEC